MVCGDKHGHRPAGREVERPGSRAASGAADARRAHGNHGKVGGRVGNLRGAASALGKVEVAAQSVNAERKAHTRLQAGVEVRGGGAHDVAAHLRSGKRDGHANVVALKRALDPVWRGIARCREGSVHRNAREARNRQEVELSRRGRVRRGERREKWRGMAHAKQSRV